MEHSLWLSMMRERIELLRNLLTDDGSIWITLDDNEVHYLKVALDEVFGRHNFVASVIWQKVYTTKNSAKYFSAMHRLSARVCQEQRVLANRGFAETSKAR